MKKITMQPLIHPYFVDCLFIPQNSRFLLLFTRKWHLIHQFTAHLLCFVLFLPQQSTAIAVFNVAILT
ncbi:hypothetical protein SE27_11695 [Acinetobacter harbinensis]|nr:hypothetical protein SE27_11695 [Acinetobacter harbinensis]